MPKNQKADLKDFRIKKKYIIALAVFAFFFIVYLVFLTDNHFSVDGATRSLEVFWNKGVELHENNHILYPFNVYSWYRLTSLFLGESEDPFEFIRRIQVMNALASSIILAFTYLIFLRFVKKDSISLALTAIFGFSNAFFNHAVSSAEPIAGFLFFVISFFLVIVSLDCENGKSKGKSTLILILSAFIFAYSIMSYLSMIFGLPFILAYIYSKTKRKRRIAGYLILFFLFFIFLFIISNYYKGIAISEIGGSLSGNKFADRSHTGLKLKNIPQYAFGMINAFYHIDSVYDLPTYISSLKVLEINSVFSVVFGLILAAIILIHLFRGRLFLGLKDTLMKRELIPLSVSLIYFLSASAALILFVPIYDKLWIMGLHSFLLFFGVIYIRLKRAAFVKILFIAAVVIMLTFNIAFALKSKDISRGNVCAEDSLNLMGDKYTLLGTWGGIYGKYFITFYYNDNSSYYRIPNLAIDNGLDSGKVVAFLKNELCNSKEPFYVVSDVLMEEKHWNTFLGDEMKMDYGMFHEELLDYVNQITECVYEMDRGDIC